MRVIRFDTQSGLGMFSSDAGFKQLVAAITNNCQLSNNWQCRTFLEFYIKTVPCPAEKLSVRRLLFNHPYGTFKFGFVDQQAINESFGLHYPVFARQLQWVLESGLLIQRKFDVDVAAVLEKEVMYWAVSANEVEYAD